MVIMMKLKEFFGSYDIVEECVINGLIKHSESIFDVYERLFLAVVIGEFLTKNNFDDYLNNSSFDRKRLNDLISKYIENKLKLGAME